MRRFTYAFILTLGTAGCSAPQVKPLPPACLNVSESERHVEFDGRNLLLAEEGTPKRLAVESGEGVRCERLEILRNAPVAAVLIQYTVQTNGVRKVGIASIKDATWIEKPTVQK